MSAPLLRDLVSQGLGLRILVGGDDLRRAIRSVHVVDLERPGHYLLPGELVLTNGLWLDRVAPATWVADVAAAGAAAIGFGVGTPHAAVPPALGEACADHGLPLLEVPEALSFAAIQDAFAARVSRDHALGVRRHLARTRALLADLTDGGGHRALLATLRRETDLDAALIGPGGRVLAAAGAIPDVASATAAERAARRGELPCSIDAHSSAFGAPGGRFLASTLLVRAPLNEISDDARLIIDQVVAYAALEDSRAWAERKAGADAARELLDLARSGDLTDAGFASRVRALGLEPGGPVCVIASLNDLESAAYAAEGAGVPYALARQDATVLLLAAVPDDEHALVARLAARATSADRPTIGR